MSGLDASVEQRDGITIVSPELVESFDKRKLLIDRKIKKLPFFAKTVDLFMTEPFQKHFSCSDSYPRLHIIGSIQTVKTISSEDSTLFLDNFASFDLIDIVPKFLDDLLKRLYEEFTVLEFVVFAFLVKIVVFVFDVGHFLLLGVY